MGCSVCDQASPREFPTPPGWQDSPTNGQALQKSLSPLRGRAAGAVATIERCGRLIQRLWPSPHGTWGKPGRPWIQRLHSPTETRSHFPTLSGTVPRTQCRLRIVSGFDFPLKFFRSSHRQRSWNYWHERDNGCPRHGGGEQFYCPRQSISRPLQNDRLHQVSCAARQDEGPEKQEHAAKRQVFFAKDEVQTRRVERRDSRPHTEV